MLFQPPAEPESLPPLSPATRPEPPPRSVEQPDAGTQPAPTTQPGDSPIAAAPPRPEADSGPEEAAPPTSSATASDEVNSGEVNADGPTAETPAPGDDGGTATTETALAKTTRKSTGVVKAGARAAKKTSTAKKTTAQKAPAKKAPAKKTAARKSTVQKTTGAKKAVAREVTAEEATGPAAARSADVAAEAAAQEPVGTANGITTVAERAALGRTAGWEAQPSTARHVIDHPGYAPELLALAAVRGLGPVAAAWVGQVRAAYPGATSDGLARLATRRFVRFAAAGGALSTATGLLAPLVELAAVTWTQAGLVLRLAAAHDHDPTHPDRAAELLVLTRFHPDMRRARAALSAAEVAVAGHADQPASGTPDDVSGGRLAGQHGNDLAGVRDAEATQPAENGRNAETEHNTETENGHNTENGRNAEAGGLAEAGRRLGAPIVARAVNRLALRLAVRRLPGAVPLAVAVLSAIGTEALAGRATAYYRAASRQLPSTATTARAGYNQSNQSRGSSA
ncbi:hypothetical protein ACN27G_31990 [Plantactinospora sp. WMMB334]|uniref:hypothetical protein n=1 Tax=Plantactinospora sp. WMMB334 TaxID=3404119 RepID=UPI003B947E0A